MVVAGSAAAAVRRPWDCMRVQDTSKVGGLRPSVDRTEGLSSQVGAGRRALGGRCVAGRGPSISSTE